MTIALELTDEEEARLRRNAKAAGKEPEEFLRSLIASLPEQQPPVQARVTPGVLLLEQLRADGALGIWKDRADSPELSRTLRQRAEKRAGAP